MPSRCRSPRVRLRPYCAPRLVLGRAVATVEAFLSNQIIFLRLPNCTNVRALCALLTCILSLRIGRQGAHIIHQIPNVIVGFHLPEGWHASEADAVPDNPKQFLVGIALDALAGEVGYSGIHAFAERCLSTTVVRMTHAAIQTVMRTTVGNARLYVKRPRRNSVAARAFNEKALSQCAEVRFKGARLWQGCQIETQERNHNQHGDSRNNDPGNS